jgi:hypothetical protein
LICGITVNSSATSCTVTVANTPHSLINMVLQTEQRHYTKEEYLELEEKAEDKSEYRDGKIILMTLPGKYLYCKLYKYRHLMQTVHTTFVID